MSRAKYNENIDSFGKEGRRGPLGQEETTHPKIPDQSEERA